MATTITIGDKAVTIADASRIACHGIDLVCLLDKHTGVAAMTGPLFTTMFTVLVAGVGWLWATNGAWRERDRVRRYCLKTADAALKGAQPLMDKVKVKTNNTDQDTKKLEAGMGNLALLVNSLSPEKWPSMAEYVAARDFRDKLLNLHAWTLRDGNMERREFWELCALYCDEVDSSHDDLIEVVKGSSTTHWLARFFPARAP